jgi:hypothetical protein
MGWEQGPLFLMAKNKLNAPTELVQVREQVFEQAGDVVSSAMVGIGSNEISKRLGRNMGRTLWCLQKGELDATLSTLADIAHATGRRLVISMEER